MIYDNKKKCKRRIKERNFWKYSKFPKQFWLSPNDWLVPSVSLTSLWPQILFKCMCNRKFGVRFLRLAPADQLSGFSLLYSVPQEAACLNSFTLGLASRNTDKIEDWEGKKLSMCSPVLWQEVAEFLHIRRCCCVAFLLWLSLLLQNFGVYLCSFFHFCLSLAS